MRFRAALAALLLALAGVAAQAAYPDRVVKIVVAYPAGGTTDILARLVAARLEQRMGQPFVVENRPGASGIVGTAAVARSEPDGYTLLMATVNTHGINSSVFKSLPYDPVKDFAPITVVASTPNVLMVHPSLGVKSVAELIARARERPGTIRFGSTSTGGSPHMSGELFKMLTRVDIQHVPYRGAGPMLNDLLGGHIEMAFDNMPSAVGLIRAGSVGALAVTTAHRWAGLPDVPTMVESGVPGYEVSAWFGFLAPARTPREVIDRLYGEIGKILREEPVRQRLAELGGEAGGEPPEAFARRIEAEVNRWADVVAATGVKVD